MNNANVYSLVLRGCSDPGLLVEIMRYAGAFSGTHFRSVSRRVPAICSPTQDALPVPHRVTSLKRIRDVQKEITDPKRIQNDSSCANDEIEPCVVEETAQNRAVQELYQELAAISHKTLVELGVKTDTSRPLTTEQVLKDAIYLIKILSSASQRQ